MGDPFMEMRAMALLELGCPPLPIADGTRFQGDQPVYANSHDLLATFMIQAFKQQDPALNIQRKRRQQDAEDAYYQRLMDGSCSPYEAMSRYTAEYMSTYLLHPCQVRVLPPDYVSPIMLKDITDYCRAIYWVQFQAEMTDPPRTLDATLNEIRRLLCLREKRTQQASNCASTSADVGLEK